MTTANSCSWERLSKNQISLVYQYLKERLPSALDRFEALGTIAACTIIRGFQAYGWTGPELKDGGSCIMKIVGQYVYLEDLSQESIVLLPKPRLRKRKVAEVCETGLASGRIEPTTSDGNINSGASQQETTEVIETGATSRPASKRRKLLSKDPSGGSIIDGSTPPTDMRAIFESPQGRVVVPALTQLAECADENVPEEDGGVSHPDERDGTSVLCTSLSFYIDLRVQTLSLTTPH